MLRVTKKLENSLTYLKNNREQHILLEQTVPKEGVGRGDGRDGNRVGGQPHNVFK